MQIFNFISGLCSIISLFLSIFVASKVIHIEQHINLNGNNIQENTMGSNNSISVGGSNDKDRP